ncbi:MAG: hypothetical protein PHY23_01690 [Oscillospiraceae bacterium]|nr:hypothetical protein [Oscillospiraceae bacterium]
MNRGTFADALLEAIRTSASFNYLSDLHLLDQYVLVHESVQQIPDDAYDAEAWQIAASYILNRKIEFASAAEIKALLLSELK